MTKILYIHQYFNTTNHAGSTRSFEFSKRLAEKKVDVTVLTGTFLGFDDFVSSKGNYVLDGIKVHNIGTKYSSKMNYLRRIISFLEFCILTSFYVIKNRKFDVVLCSSTPITVALPGILAKFFKNSKFIFEVRDLWPEMPIAVGAIKNKNFIEILYRFENYIYRTADHLIALSPGMKQGILNSAQKYGGTIKKVTIIPNSCDIEFFDKSRKFKFDMLDLKNKNKVLNIKKKINRKFLNIGYFGSVGFINDPSYIVELAFKCKEFAIIHIIGDGKLKDKAIKKAKKLNIYKKSIYFHSSVSKTGASYLMSYVDACLVSFLPVKEMEKNSSNKFFDSLASCKPTIINYGGWHSYLLKKYGAGIVLGRYEKNSMKKIRNLYEDKVFKRKLIYNVKILRQKFSRELFFERLYNIILTI